MAGRVCVLPEKWWWKQILASRWWKGMSTPSSLTELPFRSPDSSSFAKASLRKTKMTESQVSVTLNRTRQELGVYLVKARCQKGRIILFNI